MANNSLFTGHYKLPFFGAGNLYSANADYRRFISVDRHLDSYIGIVGAGVISGWVPSHTSGLSVEIGAGTGFINGYFSESGWDIIPHSSVSESDVVIEESYYTSSGGVVYDKILVPSTISLPDDSECYLYAYRNSAYLQEEPYPLPDNDSPVIEDSLTLNPSHSATAFSYTSSLSKASSSGKIFIGVVITRSGSISSIDTSNVDKLGDMDASIRNFAKFILQGHSHGGNEYYDPNKIRFDVDRRKLVLTASYDSRYEFVAQSSDRTSEVESHSHTYYVDDDGDGVTVAVYGSGSFHYHIISAGSVGDPISDSEIVYHVHEIKLRNGDDDGWDESDSVQIYINGKEYYGSAYTVNSSLKTVTFTSDITIKKREYTITHGDWAFTSEEKSLYRFMLRAAIAYYNNNPDYTNIILPDTSTPVSELKTQSIVGESRLVKEGDTFKFILPAASDVVVTLSSAAHVDEVEIEILTNSEVQGKLPQDNILYIPASKIASGEFSPERIPIIDHMGRFLELAQPIPSRLSSYDGKIYLIPSNGSATDAKTIYSVCDDGAGNVIMSTSDGIWMNSLGGSYIFSINGVQVKTNPGDILSSFYEAVSLYGRKTGIEIVVNSVYDKQLTEASSRISSVGDSYLFVGNRNKSVPGGVDRILMSYVSSYKLIDYGYTAIRSASDIKPGEIVIEVIPQEKEEDAEEEPPPLYRVVNDFNKYVVKDILLQRNVPSGYSSVSNKYFAISSYGIFFSDDVDKKWSMIEESAASGYVYSMKRAPSGIAVLSSDYGVFVSIHGAARGFRKASKPVLGVSSQFVDILPNGKIVAFSGKYFSISHDIGKTWITTEFPSTVVKTSIDMSLDKTSDYNGHLHTINVNGELNGFTSYADGHSHDVVSGVVQEANGHSHEFVRSITAFCSNGSVMRSYDMVSWETVTTIQEPRSSWTCVFSAFGKIYLSTVKSSLVYSGSSWTVCRLFDHGVVSCSNSFDGYSIYLGYEGKVSSFDGYSCSEIINIGDGQPSSFFIDNMPVNMNVYVSYTGSIVDFGGSLYVGYDVDGIYDRSSYRPDQGGWSDGINYDLYISDRLVSSTRYGINRSSMYVNVDNSGYVYFSVSGKTSKELFVGDSVLSLSADILIKLPSSGKLKIIFTDGSFIKTVFVSYSSKGVEGVTLSSMSSYSIPSGSEVSLVPQVLSSDEVRLTIYDGKLKNIGTLTHEEIENSLSNKNIGLDRGMSDVYLSNLLNLSIAADYAYPGVTSDFINSFITRFDYNDIAGDPKNIDRFIDRDSSDLSSLAIYDISGPQKTSSKLSSILNGFGVFSGMYFSASDSGLYHINSSSIELNWIRVHKFSSAYDVFQFSSSVLYVAAAEGLFYTSDPLLLEWSLVPSSVFEGVVKNISARWGSINPNGNEYYWWNKWDGVVNENPDLINTIIVSGDGFLSYSDDKGVSWLDGKFKSSGNKLSGMTPVSYGLLSNGSIAACVKASDGSRSGVYMSSGTGGVWNEIFSSIAIGGSVLSMSITDALNVKINVVFSSGSPQDGSLVGRVIYIGKVSSKIVANGSDWLISYGENMMSAVDKSFNISPCFMNCIMEDSQNRIHVGTSDGMKWDDGGSFSNDKRRDGRIISIGNSAIVDSCGISGEIQFAVPSIVREGEEQVNRISAILSNDVGVNEMNGWILSFISDVPSLTIVSNSITKPDKTVDMVVAGDISSVAQGYRFNIIGKNKRIYVSYLGSVSPDSLNGGSLIVAPQENEYGMERSSIAVFSIVRNTKSYIELSDSVKSPETIDYSSLIYDGVVVYCTYSNGTTPIAVEFDRPRTVNELSGNKLEFTDIESIPRGSQVDVSLNDETSIIISESYKAIGTDGQESIFSIFNTLYEGIDFSLSAVPLIKMPSFSDKFSSWSGGHRHEIIPVRGPIIGNVESIGSSSASEVELVLSGAWQLSDSWLSSNSYLFNGATITAYNAIHPLIKCKLTVVRHSSSSIFVAREDSKIDISGSNSNLVGPGYKIYLSATGYGRTNGIEYNSSFISSSSLLSLDTLSGSNEFNLISTTGFVVGCRVEITSNKLKFETYVSSIVGDVVTTESSSPYDFTVNDGAYIKSFWFNEEIGSATITADVEYGDTSISVSDSSFVVAGDVMNVVDSIGGYYRFNVLSVSSGQINIGPSEYLIKSSLSPVASFMRQNCSWDHDHSIYAGEFSVVSSDIRDAVGDSLNHGHRLSPIIDEVYDIGYLSGSEYVVGTGSRIYSSEDNGETWKESINLENSIQYNPTPSYIDGVYGLSSNKVAFSTSAGYYTYMSCV